MPISKKFSAIGDGLRHEPSGGAAAQVPGIPRVRTSQDDQGAVPVENSQAFKVRQVHQTVGIGKNFVLGFVLEFFQIFFTQLFSSAAAN